MADRVTTDDLSWAADWIGCFDPEDAAENERRDRVVAWLNAEVARREQDAVARAAAKELGRKPAEVKAAMRRKAAA